MCMYMLTYCSVGCCGDFNTIMDLTFCSLTETLSKGLSSHVCNLSRLPGSSQLFWVSSSKMFASVLSTVSSSEGSRHSFHSPTAQESTAHFTRNKDDHLNTSAYDSMLWFSLQQSCKSAHFLHAYDIHEYYYSSWHWTEQDKRKANVFVTGASWCILFTP